MPDQSTSDDFSTMWEPADIDYDYTDDPYDRECDYPQEPAEPQEPVRSQAEIISDTLVAVISAYQHRAPEELVDFLKKLADPQVEADLGDAAKAWQDAVEVLQLTMQGVPAGQPVDLTFVPLARHYPPDAGHLLNKVAMSAETRPDDLPSTNKAVGRAALEWAALLEQLQRSRSRTAASAYVRLLNGPAAASDLSEAHSAIVRPTRGTAATKEVGTLLVSDTIVEMMSKPRQKLRFSTGLPSVDWSLSVDKTEPLGAFAPGEFSVFGMGSGAGKSSFMRTIIPAGCQDMLNWGLRNALTVLTITEETVEARLNELQLLPSQKFHNLANNMVIYKVGGSRQELINVFFRLVARAQQEARRTGQPVAEFMPVLWFVDYLQMIVGEKDAMNKPLAAANTSDLLTHGFAQCNREYIELMSTVSYSELTGEEWPTEALKDHRIAVNAVAQLNKISNKEFFFRDPAKQQLSEFALPYKDGDPAALKWTAPDGEDYAWEVQVGDVMLLARDHIAGGAQIINNATIVGFMHRSKPFGNPIVEDPATGRKGLRDVRARLVWDKTRNGSNSTFVPLEFNSQRHGPRAQYYDPNGYRAVVSGHFTCDDMFAEYGDPMIPIRNGIDPLDAVRY